jgi:hypothetical protein
MLILLVQETIYANFEGEGETSHLLSRSKLLPLFEDVISLDLRFLDIVQILAKCFKFLKKK